MGNNRARGLKRAKDYDGEGFFLLPWAVLDSPAWAALGYPAKALLIELGRQLGQDNNGKLRLSMTYLKTRGWNSNDVVQRAKAELVEAGFIHQTVQGHRPNRASWFAVTWRSLQRLPGYDPEGEKLFVRSAYRRRPAQNASLTPSAGGQGVPDGPSAGTGSMCA